MCVYWYFCLCNDYYSVHNCMDYARSACDAAFFPLNARNEYNCRLINNYYTSINMKYTYLLNQKYICDQLVGYLGLD